jgi:hypothetical protein
MWTYQQSTGELRQNGLLQVMGYSGHPPLGVNNPSLQDVPNVGPIPEGLWYIGPPFDDLKCGPYCLLLTPDPKTDTFGRSEFLCHGDEIEHAGAELASDGCIILPRGIRQSIWLSGDHRLEVIQ